MALKDYLCEDGLIPVTEGNLCKVLMLEGRGEVLGHLPYKDYKIVINKSENDFEDAEEIARAILLGEILKERIKAAKEGKILVVKSDITTWILDAGRVVMGKVRLAFIPEDLTLSLSLRDIEEQFNHNVR